VSAGRAGSRPSRGVAALAGGARTDSSDGENVSQHCLSRQWGRIRRDLRADSPATAAVLGRSRPGAARSDRRLGRRARVSFEDPNGHLLEIITRPYGSGGTVASRPHPLVARPLEPEDALGPAGSPRRKDAEPHS